MSSIVRHLSNLIRVSLNRFVTKSSAYSTCAEESDEALAKRYQDYFNRCEIDGWDIRQGMNDLAGMDLIPDPRIIEAALRACRRVNDIALAIRWLETCKEKCGESTNQAYPYILGHMLPCLIELGIPTLEDLNYNKPQLALKDIYDM